MSKKFINPFASQGQTSAVPEDIQPSGDVSWQEGFGADYAKDYGDPTSKDIDRQQLNKILLDTTEAIAEMQTHGVDTWSALLTYPKGALVWHGDVVYQALAISTGNAPPHADWAAIGTAATLRENIKVTVGTGGDFPTINAAVLHLSRFTPDLGVTAEVELRSGFVMSEQLFVEGLNLGWITITGVDAETVINEPSLTSSLVDNHKPAFGVINGTLPTIGQLFSFSSKGNSADQRSGVMAHSLGRATVLNGCGVKSAGYNGIFASTGSTINAIAADASGSGSNGIAAFDGSTINARGVDASGSGSNGIAAATGSTINAIGVDASGSGSNGIFTSTGSTINANAAMGTLSQAANTVTSSGIIFQ